MLKNNLDDFVDIEKAHDEHGLSFFSLAKIDYLAALLLAIKSRNT